MQICTNTSDTRKRRTLQLVEQAASQWKLEGAKRVAGWFSSFKNRFKMFNVGHAIPMLSLV